MEIRELEIQNFGKFHDKTVEFGPGLNIVTGSNEAGKTTIYQFLKGMLFGMNKGRGRSRNDAYTHYTPWSNPMEYSGTLRLTSEGKQYRIRRVFQKDSKEVELYCETDGRSLSVENGDLTELLYGITESAYQNTMSIGQLGVETDSSLVALIKNYTANYYGAGSASIDVISAYRNLKREISDCDDALKKISDQRRNRKDKLGQHIEYLKEKEERWIGDIAEQKRVNFRSSRENVDVSQQSQEFVRKNEEISRQIELIWNKILKAGENEARYDERMARANEEIEDKRNAYNEELRAWTRATGLQNIINIILIVLGVAGIGAGAYYYFFTLIGLIFVFGPAVLGVVLIVIGILRMVSWRKRKKPQEPQLDSETTEALEKMKAEASASRAAMTEELKKYKEELKKNEEEIERIKDEQAANEERDNSSGKLGLLEAQLTEVRLEMSNLYDEQRELDEVTVDELELYKKKEALNFAINRLNSLATTMNRRFSGSIRLRTSEILSEITHGKYKNVSIDASLNMELDNGQRMVPLNMVSRGTIDQVYFALRMAVLEVIYGDDLPVIMDDALVFYDEARMGEALKWLSRNKKQVILFTCQNREENFLRDNGISYKRCVVTDDGQIMNRNSEDLIREEENRGNEMLEAVLGSTTVGWINERAESLRDYDRAQTGEPDYRDNIKARDTGMDYSAEEAVTQDEPDYSSKGSALQKKSDYANDDTSWRNEPGFSNSEEDRRSEPTPEKKKKAWQILLDGDDESSASSSNKPEKHKNDPEYTPEEMFGLMKPKSPANRQTGNSRSVSRNDENMMTAGYGSGERRSSQNSENGYRERRSAAKKADDMDTEFVKL